MSDNSKVFEEAAEALVSQLSPEQQQDLAERWAKRITPVSAEEAGGWQPGDYVAFKAGRRWILARVLGFRRMCSESHEVMVIEPDGTMGGVRYGGADMKLLERAPTDQGPACESYFHGRPVSVAGDIPDEAKCLDCGELVVLTPDQKAAAHADKARIDAIVRRSNERVEHSDHGRGTEDDGPDEPDCACCATDKQAVCAEAGCGFCRAAEARN